MGVIGDTNIQLYNGEVKPIKSISEGKVTSLDFENTQQLIDQNGKTTGKESNTTKLVLDSQLFCEGDENTQVIIKPRSTRKPQWESIKNIKKGDNVGIAQELPFFGKSNLSDARLIGIMIGAGEYETSNIRLSSCSDEIISYIESVGIKTAIVRNEEDEQGNKRKILSLVSVESKLSACGINKQSKKEKTLPDDWDKLNKKDLCDLLGGIVDSDANTYVEDGRKPVMYFTCNGEDLAYQLQLAFLKIGVHSKIELRQGTSKRKQDSGRLRNPLWILWIRGKENFSYLSQDVKSIVKEKQSVLNQSKDILKNHDSKVQNNIESTDIRFEKVVEVSNSGYEKVYSINVDNYVANGIFVKDFNNNK